MISKRRSNLISKDQKARLKKVGGWLFRSICIDCGGSFKYRQIRGPRRKYCLTCSPRCSKSSKSSLVKVGQWLTVSCVNCGGDFTCLYKGGSLSRKRCDVCKCQRSTCRSCGVFIPKSEVNRGPQYCKSCRVSARLERYQRDLMRKRGKYQIKPSGSCRVCGADLPLQGRGAKAKSCTGCRSHDRQQQASWRKSNNVTPEYRAQCGHWVGGRNGLKYCQECKAEANQERCKARYHALKNLAIFEKRVSSLRVKLAEKMENNHE